MSGPGTKKVLQDMPSKAWSMETLRMGLDTIELQQVKEESIDRDIQDTHIHPNNSSRTNIAELH